MRKPLLFELRRKSMVIGLQNQSTQRSSLLFHEIINTKKVKAAAIIGGLLAYKHRNTNEGNVRSTQQNVAHAGCTHEACS
jgi:hypothetical protein